MQLFLHKKKWFSSDITLHIMMTFVAMGKLIEHEPLAQAGTNFVRFNTGSGRDQRPSVVGDEEVLVTE